ncbi:MAG: TonB-dependent receptor domain-containing protein, partial [Oceanipulchritudo sp.]
ITPNSTVTLMDTFFVPTAPSPGRPFNPRNSQENIFEAAFISNISRFMNGRLLVLGGLRLDRSEADLTLQGSKTNSENESTSPQIAASYEVADDITIYASYSESFVPQVGQGDRLITPEEQAQLVADANASGTILQADDFRTQYPLLPWLGSGFEFGAKFDLLDGKLSGSMAYFDVTLEQISQKNSIPVDLDALGYSDPLNRGVIYPQVDLPNNVRSVKGFETELFLRPFEGFQAVVSYAYIEAGETLDLGFRQFESPAITVPLHQVSVWTKYEFNEGRLEGAYLGGGFTWMDKRYGSFQLSVENPSPTVKDGRVSIDRNILLDDQITFDLLFGYKFTAKSADVDIQVNIKNLLDDRFILPGGMPNAPLQAFVSFQMKL